MVLDRATGEVRHSVFRDLHHFLRPADLLVRNVSRVLPARFTARRATGAHLDALFVRADAPDQWTVLLTGAGRLRAGESLELVGCDARITLLDRLERGLCRVQLSQPQPAEPLLSRIGRAPLPPYIRRAKAAADPRDASDRDEYQTVYAAEAGSVAAPTAGMHFTSEQLDQLRRAGVNTADVILHVGLGTFAPVEADDLDQHPMHTESFDLPDATVRAINAARRAGGRIVAVGTTTVRVLESVAVQVADSSNGGIAANERERDSDQAGIAPLRAMAGSTNILIQPPWQFRAVDALITNFHLPGSTLLALVAAFAGLERTLDAYRIAIENDYRFFSYGDAMLIV
ncbi:S-adenosylmethionine:tRNA ribosyltransferase-isomerase [Phycisphaerae bacterium RAS2]|nr:S-adenosylmethionine:tRNA ribosyltransferase-isomerase [Phycisphaerae bacterium RAS2]